MNSYNTRKAVDKEPMDLSQIISNFFKALKKLWIIMVVAIIACGFIGHHNYSAGYSPNYETKATFSITAAQMMRLPFILFSQGSGEYFSES